MRKAILGVVAFCGLVSNSMAAIITYETRNINQVINNLDYKSSWESQTSAITVQNLADFNGSVVPGGVQGGFSYLNVGFNTAVSSTGWAIRMAPDAGYGGEMYLDGNLLSRKSHDLWWGGNWNNATQILSASNLTVNAGNHVFTAYWAEGCCNGGQGLQYSTDGLNWHSMSNLASPAAVPVPGAIWIFGTGLISMLTIGRKKLA